MKPRLGLATHSAPQPPSYLTHHPSPIHPSPQVLGEGSASHQQPSLSQEMCVVPGLGDKATLLVA